MGDSSSREGSRAAFLGIAAFLGVAAFFLAKSIKAYLAFSTRVLFAGTFLGAAFLGGGVAAFLGVGSIALLFPLSFLLVGILLVIASSTWVILVRPFFLGGRVGRLVSSIDESRFDFRLVSILRGRLLGLVLGLGVAYLVVFFVAVRSIIEIVVLVIIW